jgi:small-conductance mechanosensitive channel
LRSDTAAGTAGVALPPITWAAVTLGATVLAVGWLAAWVLGRLTAALLPWRGRSPSASRMFASLTRWLVGVLAVAAALTVVFPSVKPVNALGGIGVLSIAAGIAFQTVLGNMFAGIVILARDVFRVGDQIAVEGVAGTVTAITLTSTKVKTFDGRLVLIPNAVVHSQIVTVQTGYEQVRTSVTLDIDDGADLDLAVRVAEQTMAAAPDVLTDPAPQALLQAVGSATVELELRFWSGARQMETRRAQHEVIRRVLGALRDAEVKTGSDVLVVDAAPGLREALGHSTEEPR